MNFPEFLKLIEIYRSSKNAAFSKPAALTVYDYILSHKVDFDDENDFKLYVNSLREKSIDDLQEDANRVFEDRDDVADYINDKDDHYFIGITNNSVVYTFNPPREERW